MKKTAKLCIYIIAAFLPLVYCFHIEAIDFSKYPWFPNQDYWIDLFLYGKSWVIRASAVVMSASLLVTNIKNRKRTVSFESCCVLIIGVFLMLSAVFSGFSEQTLKGSIEQYESVYVLLSYLVIGVFCCSYVKKEKSCKSIRNALLIGLMLSCVIGLFQILQNDLWETDLGKRLLIPETFATLRENLRFSEDYMGWKRVYMALYNPTYAGIYLVMLLPLLFFGKNKWMKLLLIPVGLCLIGTMSKTAVAVAVVLVLLNVWMRSEKEAVNKFLNKKIFAGTVIAVTIIAGVLIMQNGNGVLNQGKRLQKVETQEDQIKVIYKGNALYLSEFPKDAGVTYKIVDEDGNEPMLLWVPERGEMDSQDPRFSDLHFKVYSKDERGYIYFRYADVIFRFTDELGTGKYEYISINGKPDELELAKTFINVGDSLLNGRGYIWNRVIPMIAEKPILGTGPDTFLQVFPQDDYVARANLGYGFFTEILTNAHSFYLQIALQNGLIVLICFMGLMAVYLKKSWKMYVHKDSYDEMDRMGAACFLGTIGYLLCGLVFASSVCTTPIFAVLVGTGIGIQKINH